MVTSTNASAARSRRIWTRWIFSIFAAVALLLLVFEHRMHALGWWPHALVVLCVVLAYLLLQVDARDAGRDGSR